MCCNVKPDIKFGTDGWRGVISENFTFDNVKLVARAIADYYNARNNKVRIAVGFDTRFMSDRYARISSEVLASSGIDVFLSDRCVPTPTLSFAVKLRKLTAGVMITASHNPASYNGIKIKTAEGGAAGVEVTREVEDLINNPSSGEQRPSGKINKVDLTGDYVEFLRGYIDLKVLKKASFRVLVDALHGSGNSFIKDVLKGTKIKLEFLRSDINPSFGGLRPEPVLENLEVTFGEMKKKKFDLGLVLDGDADRIAAFAGKGEFLNPQKVLGLLILHLIQDRKMSGDVVKTLVGSNLIDNICSKLGLKLYETPVGFKYISELMIKEDILVGGEEAGGIGFKDYIPERDGSLAGLLLLEMMAFRKKPMLAILKDMEKEFGRYYYLRTELKLQDPEKTDISPLKGTSSVLGKKVVKVNDSDGLKFILEDSSWLMMRTSGTEPIIRIYSESKSETVSAKMLDFGKELILKNVV
jgi:alpha-D-glucose phosphate-specific phosphoglucomutase